MKYNNQESGLLNSYYKDYELGLSAICSIPRPQIRSYLNRYNTSMRKLTTNFYLEGYKISCSVIPKNYFNLSGYKEFIFEEDESDKYSFGPIIKSVIEDKPLSTILTTAFSNSTVMEEAYRMLNKKSRKKILEFDKLICINQSIWKYSIRIYIRVGKHFLELHEQSDRYSVNIGQNDSVSHNTTITTYSQSKTSLNYPGGNATKMKEDAGKTIAKILNEEFNKE